MDRIAALDTGSSLYFDHRDPASWVRALGPPGPEVRGTERVLRDPQPRPSAESRIAHGALLQIRQYVRRLDEGQRGYVVSGLACTVPVDATVPYRSHLFAGWGPFRADFISPPAGQRLELWVWSPGGETVHVYGATLAAAEAAAC